MNAPPRSRAGKNARARASVTPAHNGEPRPGSASRDGDIASPPPALRLTRREHQVLILLCEGLPNKEIARRLKISVGTVKVHVANIFRALRVSNRLQAVLRARCWELLREPINHSEHAPDPGRERRRR